MFRSVKMLAGTAALVLSLSAAAQAEPIKYIMDKPHTQIVFIANHLGFSHSYGKFTDYAGSFIMDEADPSKSSAEITIQTASIDLDDEKWNAHMKNADFLNVEKFPTMTFKSTKVDVTGDKTADITGDLTLLGVTKPVVLKVTQNGAGEHPMSKKKATGFSATTTIKRSDFGMTYGIPNVADDVEIRIEVEGAAE